MKSIITRTHGNETIPQRLFSTSIRKIDELKSHRASQRTKALKYVENVMMCNSEI